MNQATTRKLTAVAFGLAVAGLLAGCAGVAQAPDTDALVNQYVEASFLPGEGQDLTRLKQDETQKDCSASRARPSKDLAKAITTRELKNIVYPASGKLMGDWKAGAKIFNGGFAYRIGSFIPSNPKAVRGGNCYACHQGEKKELAYGNLGSSLQGYGKMRVQGEALVKYTYQKIYNAKAFKACSNMPRLGHNGILSPEQVADLTAYLVDPASTLNQ